MRNSLKHIDNFLREKLGQINYQSDENDWNDFQNFRKKKKRRPLFIFWLSAAGIAACAIVAISFFQSQPDTISNSSSSDSSTSLTPGYNNSGEQQTPSLSEKGIPDNGVSQPGDTATSPSSSEHSLNPPLAENNTPGKEISQPGKIETSPSNKQNPIKPGGKPTPKTNYLPPKKLSPKELLAEKMALDSIRREDSLRGIITVRPVNTASSIQMVWVRSFRSVVPQYIRPNLKEVNPVKKSFHGTGRAVFLSLSQNRATPKLIIEGQPAQTHKDFADKLKKGIGRTSSFEVDAGYRISVFSKLQVSAGIQYSRATQHHNFQFLINEVPAFDSAGNIFGYIIYPDSMSERVDIQQTQNQQSISVPVEINYSFNLTRRLSLGFGVNAAIGYSWGNNMPVIDRTELSANLNTNSINPLRLNLGGSVFGEYRWSSSWGTRAGVHLKSQNAQYRANNGYNIKNNFYGFNLILIRYL